MRLPYVNTFSQLMLTTFYPNFTNKSLLTKFLQCFRKDQASTVCVGRHVVAAFIMPSINLFTRELGVVSWVLRHVLDYYKSFHLFHKNNQMYFYLPVEHLVSLFVLLLLPVLGVGGGGGWGGGGWVGRGGAIYFSC